MGRNFEGKASEYPLWCLVVVGRQPGRARGAAAIQRDRKGGFLAAGDKVSDCADERVGCGDPGSPQACLHNLVVLDESIRDRESYRQLRETLNGRDMGKGRRWHVARNSW